MFQIVLAGEFQFTVEDVMQFWIFQSQSWKQLAGESMDHNNDRTWTNHSQILRASSTTTIQFI